MAKKSKPRPAPRGIRMRKGSGWRLTDGQHVLIGTLVWTYNANGGRLAIFSVPKGRLKRE
jgi:hypothetical protein